MKQQTVFVVEIHDGEPPSYLFGVFPTFTSAIVELTKSENANRLRQNRIAQIHEYRVPSTEPIARIDYEIQDGRLESPITIIFAGIDDSVA
ncbi:hypothetical protein [Merismopedia glauca]|uniref:Uncharacterized protein n=1 Tax=Merismopedia glauca CCAP 1448/3 TaxID=1296344 RepID=A0A2T1BZE5_9CYAN|nr:hypothetical protein [Merismopedia glauca]PSB01396.1 hypothetical protein C7B64_18580 [Merismopedia glauca CCAP 1448/3]